MALEHRGEALQKIPWQYGLCDPLKETGKGEVELFENRARESGEEMTEGCHFEHFVRFQMDLTLSKSALL